jgi:hypothetical protein
LVHFASTPIIIVQNVYPFKREPASPPTLHLAPASLALPIPSAVPEPADAIALRQADQARTDFAAIEGDLQFIMERLARLPSRAWLATMGLLGFGSVWALIAVLLLLR